MVKFYDAATALIVSTSARRRYSECQRCLSRDEARAMSESLWVQFGWKVATHICYCCDAIGPDSPLRTWALAMIDIKSGDLVVLKSGGPIMTVDTVNTDIMDDDKVTGVFCVWFVGDKLERARFDHRAIEPAQEGFSGKRDAGPEEATDDYKVILDEMCAAMNISAEIAKGGAKPATKGLRRTSAANFETLATASSVDVVVS